MELESVVHLIFSSGGVGRSSETIEHRHIGASFIQRLGDSSGAPDKALCAHLVPRITGGLEVVVRDDDPLCEIRMEAAFHSFRIAVVPTLDVIQRGPPNLL